jgi:hypothetical protein
MIMIMCMSYQRNDKLYEHTPFPLSPVSACHFQAGKDLLSSLASGPLTIGSQFGGVLGEVAAVFSDAWLTLEKSSAVQGKQTS